MKYPLDFRKQVIEMAKKESVRQATEFFKVPEVTVRRWKRKTEEAGLASAEDMPDVKGNGETAKSRVNSTEEPDRRLTAVPEPEQTAEIVCGTELSEQLSEEKIPYTQNEDKSPYSTEGQSLRTAGIREQMNNGIKDSFDIIDVLLLENEKLRKENHRLKTALIALVQEGEQSTMSSIMLTQRAGIRGLGIDSEANDDKKPEASIPGRKERQTREGRKNENL